MKKYITSDKVGEFCQSMFANGLQVILDADSLSVRLSNRDYVHIDIYAKGAYESLVASVLEAERKAQEEVSFDQLMNTATAKEA